MLSSKFGDVLNLSSILLAFDLLRVQKVPLRSWPSSSSWMAFCALGSPVCRPQKWIYAPLAS